MDSPFRVCNDFFPKGTLNRKISKQRNDSPKEVRPFFGAIGRRQSPNGLISQVIPEFDSFFAEWI